MNPMNPLNNNNIQTYSSSFSNLNEQHHIIQTRTTRNRLCDIFYFCIKWINVLFWWFISFAYYTLYLVILFETYGPCSRCEDSHIWLSTVFGSGFACVQIFVLCYINTENSRVFGIVEVSDCRDIGKFYFVLCILINTCFFIWNLFEMYSLPQECYYLNENPIILLSISSIILDIILFITYISFMVSCLFCNMYDVPNNSEFEIMNA